MVESEPKRELKGVEVAMGGSSAGSEVVMMDDRILETAARSAVPPVHNLNVSRSSRIHIGPKFVSVTQNVDNTEVVKGRIMGLELVSPKNTRRLRCSIAVFVCWALVVACVLTFVIFQYALAKPERRLDIGINEPWYLRRADWQAMPDYGIDMLDLPVANVLIGHSALDHCTDKYSCIKNVLEIQRDHQRRGWKDIGPNFLVGGNGLLFEGRGANVVGVMVRSWNLNGISVMFLGNYQEHETSAAQFDHVNALLEVLVRLKVLKPDYVLYGHCQVTGAIISPGPHIMDNLHNFEHWNPANKSTCIR